MQPHSTTTLFYETIVDTALQILHYLRVVSVVTSEITNVFRVLIGAVSVNIGTNHDQRHVHLQRLRSVTVEEVAMMHLLNC
jgi:hypothetical protein